MFAVFVSGISAQIVRDEFDKPELDTAWSFVRNPDKSRWSLTERPNFLRLKGSTVTLDDTEVAPVLVGRKQLKDDFEVVAAVDFQPREINEAAGLTLRQNERQHYEFGIRKSAAGRELFLRYAIGSIRPVVLTEPLPAGVVKLKIRGFPKYYRFSYAVAGNREFIEIGGVETKYLEATDGLKDVSIGLFASGNGRESTAPADFDWVEYDPNPKDPYADIAVNDPSLPKGYTIFSVDTAEKGIIAKYPFITCPPTDVPAEIEARKGLVYASYGSRQMRLDLFKPRREGVFPAIIIVHGGAWITGHHTMENPLAIALARRGFVTATVEYRLSNEAKYPAQIHDLKAAVRWLRANAGKLGIDARRLAAIGASSGGHLVALLGATNDLADFEGNGGNAGFSSRVQSVVDIDGTATFIDPGNIEKEIKGPYDTNTRLTGFTYAENPDVWRNASPITHVNRKSAPVLFLNSSSNRPFQQREEMSAKLNALGIRSEIVVVPDTPHPFWLFRPWFDTTVLNVESFLRQTMK